MYTDSDRNRDETMSTLNWLAQDRASCPDPAPYSATTEVIRGSIWCEILDPGSSII